MMHQTNATIGLGDAAIAGGRKAYNEEPLGAQGLHQLFEQQVQRSPGRSALIATNREISYQELNERADRLANHLVELGFTPGAPAGIFLDRSIEMVVALLAIFKSGGVYVPMDVEHPRSRLEYIVKDAGLRFVITTCDYVGRANWGPAKTILLDQIDATVRPRAANPGGEPVTAEDPAYIVYTSGSTGSPKGVVIPHRVFIRCRRWAEDIFQFTSEDRFLFKSFRAPEELFFPFSVGAAAVIAPPDAERDPALLIDTAIRKNVTVLGLTPAVLTLLASERRLADCRSLKQVFSSGEGLSTEMARRFLSRRDVQLYNFYGLAEAPFTALWKVRGDEAGGYLPIGQPFDATVEVLNPRLQPATAEEIGEIYVAGPGLALRYLNQPDLTAERFRNDVLGKTRFYRTGDLGYRREDGTLFLTGRADFQIKVRGFRLELGELESALETHPAVRQAGVIRRRDRRDGHRLTAYLWIEKGALITADELRDFLSAKLPDYAMPSEFRVVEAMPLTTTGKIDRASLESQFSSELPGGIPYVPARNEPERRLIKIWQELLGSERIGVHDNFFHLGGHSLSATQVVARIRSEFGLELPLREFFDAPTVAGLAARLSGKTSERERLFRRQTRDGPLALSFAQERLWFLDRLEPGSSAYHIPDAYLIDGPVDVTVLERSLRAVADRHELLRTTLQMRDGRPVQVISPTSNLSITSIDRSSESEAEQEAEIVRQIKENSETVFDLETGPLLQLKLVRLGVNRYVLLVNMHHVVSDDWSLGVFYRELSQFYEAFLTGKEAELPPLPIQYADYAVCQRQWLEEGELERQLVYWRQQLTGTPTLELPLDFPRPPKQTFVGTRIPFQLSTELTSRLKAFNRAENATHFMTLLAAFQVLLSRYSGQDDIVVGVPIANRRHMEVEALFGFFVNMLVLRGDLSGEPSFRELVRRVRVTALDAYQNQDLPFEKLVEDINPVRDLSRPPLFQVMFAIHDVPTHPLRIPNAVTTRRVHAVHATHFDLEFYLSTAAEPWSGFIGFNTALFAIPTIERMIGHYQTLLESLLSESNHAVFAAPMLSKAERLRLIEPSSCGVKSEGPSCIHQLFEQQVDRSPQAVAIRFENKELTYHELDVQANALANELKQAGVTIETKVGICVERSLEMVVAMLAVLKAGGAYVPIDIHFPPERVSLILDDAGAEVLIVHESVRRLCPEFRGRMISLDERLSGSLDERLSVPVRGDNAAYVYYTSGSTGRPKGVVLEHRSVVNFLRAMQHEPGITSGDVVLALTTISFDPAVLDIFLPLSVGARVVIVPEETRYDPEELLKLLHQSGATILQATPTTWQLLMRSEWIRKELRALIGGEILTPELARQILRRCGELWNLYGPTETTVWSTVARIDDPDDITIGRTIPNQRAYIVDRHNQLSPIGVPGELLMGGIGVGRYYVAQPELTASRFVPNPFSSNADDRVYRTGDLCRYRPDGRIEFLGRIDHQIKIRGFRVEPGEIEALLVEHPLVRQGVVVDRIEDCGERRLIGYVVPVSQSTVLESADLREFLKRKLPDYMVPAAFVVLEQLPLTRTGKIDRRALPAPTPAIRNSSNGGKAPRNRTEEQLLRIWEQVLQMSGVGLTDDFFQIGGHSLMAVRLMAEVNSVFGVRLPLATIFRNSTVEALARVVTAGHELHLKPTGLIPPPEGETGQRVFWMPSIGSVERFVECHRLVRLLRGDYRFFGFDPAPDIGDIGGLADHCLQLIRAEQPAGPYFLAGYCQSGHVAYEVATRLERDGHEIALLAIIDSSGRDFAPGARQRLRWVRDGLNGDPRAVLRRAKAVVRRRLVRRNGNHRQQTDNNAPANPFIPHLNVVRQHRPRSFRGKIELIRSDEWLENLPHSPKLGWDGLARSVRLHPVHCRHLSVLTDARSLQIIADMMKEALETHPLCPKNSK